MSSLDQQQQQLPSQMNSSLTMIRVTRVRLVIFALVCLLVSAPIVLLLTVTLIYENRNPESERYAILGCALWMLYYVANLYCCDWYFFRNKHNSQFERKCSALAANHRIFRFWLFVLFILEPLYTLIVLVTPYSHLPSGSTDEIVCHRVFCQVDAHVYAAFWWTMTHLVLVFTGTLAFVYLANTPAPTLISDHCEMINIVNGVTMGVVVREKTG